ncbi:MAG: D-aminoacyl-tRNA deacylase [Steroidobacteraceae bacterium]
MIGLLQRVTEAEVRVSGEAVGAIGPGLLVLVGVEKGDTAATAERLLERIVTYRVFSDDSGRMNLDLLEHRGDLLLVPQFTLAAETGKGRRPGFSTAATPEQGKLLFEQLVAHARHRLGSVETGVFGANMQVRLTNDGPVTFWLQAHP